MFVLSHRYKSFRPGGDSITNGSYVDIIGAAIGCVPQRMSMAGSGAAEAQDFYFPFDLPPSGEGEDLMTACWAINDACTGSVGLQPDRQDNFFASYGSALACVMMQNPAGKFRAQANTSAFTGSWTATSDTGGTTGMQSHTCGDKFNFTIPGPIIYLSMMMIDGNGGAYTVKITDGGIAKTYGPFYSKGKNGTYIQNNLGRHYASGLMAFRGLQDEDHDVEVEIVSPTSTANVVQVDWWGTPRGHRFPNGISMFVGLSTFQRHGYDNNTAAIAAFNRVIKRLVATLQADGLPIALMPHGEALNRVTAFDSTTDDTHPLPIGHEQIATADLAVILPQSASVGQGGDGFVPGLKEMFRQDGKTLAVPYRNAQQNEGDPRLLWSLHYDVEEDGNFPVVADLGAVEHIGTRGGAPYYWSQGLNGGLFCALYGGRFGVGTNTPDRVATIAFDDANNDFSGTGGFRLTNRNAGAVGRRTPIMGGGRADTDMPYWAIYGHLTADLVGQQAGHLILCTKATPDASDPIGRVRIEDTGDVVALNNIGIETLPVYPDNTAAAAHLAAGRLYTTGIGDPRPIYIVY